MIFYPDFVIISTVVMSVFYLIYLGRKRGNNVSEKYNVIIVGAGPAGIFTALELVDKVPELSILILEKGKDIDDRHCPSKEKNIQCLRCKPCSIVNGWGGAGAFSDVNLPTTEFGGWLDEYISRKEVMDLINYVDKIYLSLEYRGNLR